MSLPREPLFLARQNYRLRRIADAARGLPWIGMVLFMLPLLAAGQGRNDTVGWLIFIFVTWMVLIVIAAILSRGMGRNRIDQGGNEKQQETGREGNP
ncbi:hypothetical protein O2N63_08890 [Aliiroseovarius sp. KMU-50]|uniref:Uncharacterized protein n=1 Tax=Aliiroseovarius salicola TaxID=3009082 RepID=A0ABT4W1A9_9RHOB|nr:hypothetical protein [Aliiroseovarius sp. KMU-50]MDA5094204.1 hypothetical protein [Aliiroseovarius sp. KMU-50]